jgi:hypothetical protein
MSRANRRRRAHRRRYVRKMMSWSCKILLVYADRSALYFQQVYLPLYRQALDEAYRAAGITEPS